MRFVIEPGSPSKRIPSRLIERVASVLVFMACALIGVTAELDSEIPFDEVVVKGDTLRGKLVAIETDGVRFKTVYGEGELFIRAEDIELLKVAGQVQTHPFAGPDKAKENREEVSLDTNTVVTTTVNAPPEEESFSLASPDSIESQIQEEQKIQETFFERAEFWLGLPRYYQLQGWLDRKLGLRMGIAYTALAMGGTDAVQGDQGAASGDFDFFGRWEIWGKESGNTGTIGFNLRDRHKYTQIPPSTLGTHLGSLWNVTAGFGDTGFDLTQLYIDQYFLDKNVGFRFGQIFQDLHFDTYSYKSAKLYFLNAAFSDNPAVAFPEFGVGFATLIRPVPDWYVLTGVGDAQGRKLEAGISDIFTNDKLFSGLELGWRPSRGLLQDHSLALFGWFTPADSDTATPDGSGITLTYEWRPKKPYSLFARYAWSASRATTVGHLGTAGVVWRNAVGRELDVLGVAAGWGAPTAPALHGQGVIEVFYRLQLTPLLQLTPDVQMLITPSLNPEQDLIAVFGLRARLSL